MNETNERNEKKMKKRKINLHFEMLREEENKEGRKQIVKAIFHKRLTVTMHQL